MAHLGADVAAFVDGQLSEDAMLAATAHLESCEECRRSARQQRLVKSRMSTVATPELPATLLASLAGMASTPPRRESWWVRLRRSTSLRAGFAVAGASAIVVVTAYAVGSTEQVGDEVTPPFESFAADFSDPSVTQASDVISESAMNALDGRGWPCHATLAGDLQRTSGSYADNNEIVALSYTNGTDRLNLFEQNGSLDHDRLEGFEQAQMSRSRVWVRDGVPSIVTWDDEGVVYTIVTDADRERVARAVADLPRDSDDDGLADRVGDGLNRMAAWVDAA